MIRTRSLTISVILLLLLGGCGGGGVSSSTSAMPPSSGSGNSSTGGTSASGGGTASAQSATGIWEGSATSQASGQTVPVFGLVDGSGMSLWMTINGQVIAGAMNSLLAGAELPMSAYVDGGATFPNGAIGGPMTFVLDTMTAAAMSARMAGLGDTFALKAQRGASWNRPASLAILAGVYSRATSSGYAVSMAIDANGVLTANDSRGCTINGTVTVPDPAHDLYKLTATVTACGALNGTYAGMGTLLDASAMTSWMQQMIPLAHTVSSAGGTMAGGMGGMMTGQNTVPSGAKNLFMFALVNDQHAIMDALAR